MFNRLENIDRTRIISKNRYKDAIYLNRAERVEEIDQNILKNINFNLGSYYDLNPLYEKLEKYLNINTNKILLTNGAEEAIRYIFNIFLKDGDNVMYPIPTYGMYNVYSKIYNVNTILLDYDIDFKINKKKLYENLNKCKVFFLPNPSHIEDLFCEKEISKICTLLKENDGILVVDETYYGFGSKSMIELVNNFNNLYVIRSFSKTFGLPSIRIGCLIGNSKNISIISNYRPAYEISYPSFKISEYFLDNINIVNNYITDCIDGRQYLINKFKENNIKYNGESNYLLNIFLDNKDKCNEITLKLEENKIFVKSFEKYISITIGPIKYMKIFLEILL